MGYGRGLRRAVALAGAALLCVPIFATPARAVLATPYTHAYMEWDDGTPVVDTDTVAVFSSSTSADGFLVGPGNAIVLGFFAPTGQSLGIGEYQSVVLGTSPTAIRAAVLVSGSVTCTTGSGTVDVDDVASAANGSVTSFSARFVIQCNGRGLRGALSYQSTFDYRTRSVMLTPATFPPVTVGSYATRRVTITNHGPSDLGGFLLMVPDNNFTLEDNNCVAGESLGVGASCTATIMFRPSAPRPQSGTLYVVDNSNFSALAIPLTASAISTPPPVLRTLTLDTSSIDFGPQRVGTYNFEHDITLRNTGNAPVHLHMISAPSNDLQGWTDCPATIQPGGSCLIGLYFVPVTKGTRRDTLVVTSDATNGTQRVPLIGRGTLGYYLLRGSGITNGFGDAQHMPAAAFPPSAPAVALTTSTGGEGVWIVNAQGRVVAEGNAPNKGDLSHLALTKPIVGITRTQGGNGYWLVASDGGVFSFGNAKFHGSTGAIRLNKPIVGMATTPSGKGYWLVASDGGIFSFGDAKFYGSTGAMRLNKPIVGMAATPSGRGYWLVASDGGIFSFGDAHFYGSTGALRLTSPIVGMTAAPDGRGYWFVARDGGLFSFGTGVEFDGSLGGQGVNDVVGMAGTAPPVTWVYGSAAAVGARATGQRVELRHSLGTIAPAWAERLTN